MSWWQEKIIVLFGWIIIFFTYIQVSDLLKMSIKTMQLLKVAWWTIIFNNLLLSTMELLSSRKEK